MDDIYSDARFNRYFELLIEWNEKFNLTKITARDEVYKKHFLDSILPAKLIPFSSSVLDVGSGAGFPGIPLKLIRPDISLTMLDSLLKRVGFLNTVISELNLTNTNAVHCRAEEFDKKGCFEVVVSRAVAPLNVLSEYCLPFVKTGGIFIAYKSSAIDDELRNAEKAISILGGDLPVLYTRRLDEETERTFVVIKKIKTTPDKYPRKGNKPRLQPL